MAKRPYPPDGLDKRVVVARGVVPLTPEWAKALEGLVFVDVAVDPNVPPGMRPDGQ